MLPSRNLDVRDALVWVVCSVLCCVACQPPDHLKAPAKQPRPQRTDIPEPSSHTSDEISLDLLVSEDVENFTLIRPEGGWELFTRLRQSAPKPPKTVDVSTRLWNLKPDDLRGLGIRKDRAVGLVETSGALLVLGLPTRESWSLQAFSSVFHINGLEASVEDRNGVSIQWFRAGQRAYAARVEERGRVLLWLRSVSDSRSVSQDPVAEAVDTWVSRRSKARLWMSPAWSDRVRSLHTKGQPPLLGVMRSRDESVQVYRDTQSWLRVLTHEVHTLPLVSRWEQIPSKEDLLTSTLRGYDPLVGPPASLPHPSHTPCKAVDVCKGLWTCSTVWSAEVDGEKIAVRALGPRVSPREGIGARALQLPPQKFMVDTTLLPVRRCGPNPLRALFSAQVHDARVRARAPRVTVPYRSALDSIAWSGRIASGALLNAPGERDAYFKHPSVHDGWVAMEAREGEDPQRHLEEMAALGLVQRRVDTQGAVYDWFRTAQRFATLCVVGRWVIAARPNHAEVCQATLKDFKPAMDGDPIAHGFIDGVHRDVFDGLDLAHSVRWTVSAHDHNREVHALLWGGRTTQSPRSEPSAPVGSPVLRDAVP